MIECTPEQNERWRTQYSEGYRVGRGDVQWNAEPRIPLVSIPAEMPGETGAEYVAKHAGLAWQIGYARAYRFESGRTFASV